MVGSLDIAIREALDRLGRTQNWLAEQVDVTPQAVHKWIKTGQISREKATEVAQVLGLSLDAMLTGADAASAEIGQLIVGLPPESQQQALDFIRYKFERSEGLIASDKAAHYMAMIDRIKTDMAHKKAAEPPRVSAKKPQGKRRR